MSKHAFRKLTLVAAITVLAVTRAHAQTSTPPPPPPPATPNTVTGTDPEPTSPNVIDMILTILYLA
jgi:hypothetical protein